MAIVISVLSRTVYDIFAKQIKCQNYYLENRGHGQGGEKHARTIRLNLFDSIHGFSQNFNYPAIYVYAKRIHTQRETGVMTIGKV